MGKSNEGSNKKRKYSLCPFCIYVRLWDIHWAKRGGEKTNKILEIPKLLELIDIKDCTVTIDTIGTQKDIMNKITGKGGHFCLQLKKNQRTAFEDVDLFFNDLKKNHKKEFKKLSSYTKTAKDHGCIKNGNTIPLLIQRK